MQHLMFLTLGLVQGILKAQAHRFHQDDGHNAENEKGGAPVEQGRQPGPIEVEAFGRRLGLFLVLVTGGGAGGLAHEVPRTHKDDGRDDELGHDLKGQLSRDEHDGVEDQGAKPEENHMLADFGVHGAPLVQIDMIQN